MSSAQQWHKADGENGPWHVWGVDTDPPDSPMCGIPCPALTADKFDGAVTPALCCPDCWASLYG